MNLLCVCIIILLAVAAGPVRAEPKNWLGGGREAVGTFTQTSRVVHPWWGVDASGFLRQSVAFPTTNPFISRSNQFSYAWMGTSVAWMDWDGDDLPDLLSADGGGIFWFWRNVGTRGAPEFERGEVVPLLVDDLRSRFAPILPQTVQGSNLTPAQQSEKKRVDERREKELERLKKRNQRRDENERQSDQELEQEVARLFPYSWENVSEDPGGAASPPGGTVCTLNSFRRLRGVVTVADWNGDRLPDVLVGDSAGTVYFARNTGRPGQPIFGYFNRTRDALPLKVRALTDPRGRKLPPQPVEFLNYAMPYACDWNGDGVMDLLLGEGTYSVNAVRLYPSASRATAASPPREVILYSGGDRVFLAPFAWDQDGDGRLDLYVADAEGRLTIHRQLADGTLDAPRDLRFTNKGDLPPFSVPQPADWNEDGVMDLLWVQAGGLIQVALGRKDGLPDFEPPLTVKARQPPPELDFPHHLVAVAAPARHEEHRGIRRHGGTGSAERYVSTEGETREDSRGWPNDTHQVIYGLMPGWPGQRLPDLAKSIFNRDKPGQTESRQPSWAIAPFPGDVWESVEEAGAPGQGRTLLLRWHSLGQEGIFKSRLPDIPRWTPGAAVHFPNNTRGPFCTQYTRKPILVRFHYRLTGAFTRLDVQFISNWGPLGSNRKPPAEGGRETFTLNPPAQGAWNEVSWTIPPHKEYARGLDAGLSIELIGRGELRLRDVRIQEQE